MVTTSNIFVSNRISYIDGYVVHCLLYSNLPAWRLIICLIGNNTRSGRKEMFI